MESIEKLRRAATGCFEGSTGDVIKNAMVLYDLDSPNTPVSVLFNKMADEIETLYEEEIAAAELGSMTCAFARQTDLTNGCALLERITELEAERDNLAKDLLACNKEREHYRKAFAEALTRASEIVSLQP